MQVFFKKQLLILEVCIFLLNHSGLEIWMRKKMCLAIDNCTMYISNGSTTFSESKGDRQVEKYDFHWSFFFLNFTFYSLPTLLLNVLTRKILFLVKNQESSVKESFEWAIPDSRLNIIFSVKTYENKVEYFKEVNFKIFSFRPKILITLVYPVTCVFKVSLWFCSGICNCSWHTREYYCNMLWLL